jgi:hypothetical protein
MPILVTGSEGVKGRCNLYGIHVRALLYYIRHHFLSVHVVRVRAHSNRDAMWHQNRVQWRVIVNTFKNLCFQDQDSLRCQ